MICDPAVDLPRTSDFVAPYFFFASSELTEVTCVSPSVENVLGYQPEGIPGLSYRHFLCEDPLNSDLGECEQMELRDGETIHALRSVFNSKGQQRILLVHTVGVADSSGEIAVRRHNIAHDVTESVRTHQRLMERLRKLETASRQLTFQENEIAERVLEGKMNRDIAKELNVSDRTVERRRANIMKHMDAATTSELIAKLVERDLLRTWTDSACDAQWRLARNAHAVYS